MKILNRENQILLIFISLLALLLFLLPASCSAASQETKLTQIETLLNQLEQDRQQSLKDLKILRSELQTSREALQAAKKNLTAAQQELTELKLQLKELKQRSTAQEQELQKYENYCKRLEKNQRPKVMNEYALKASEVKKISGFGYGKYYQIFDSYYGLKADYDWEEKKVSLWLSYLS